MLYLRADYAKKLNCKYSIFVSFQYNPTYINIIKQLSSRSWDNNSKEWEIGQDSYDDFMNKVKLYGIPYNELSFRQSVNALKEKVAKATEIKKEESIIDLSILNTFEFKTKPRDYQLEGIKFGLTHDKYLNADQMGLGKSLQAINTAIIKRGGKHCLIVVGYGTLQYNWVNEIRKHSNEDAYILGQRYKKRSGELYKGSTEDILEDLNNIDNIKEFFLITSISTIRHAVKVPYIDKQGKKKFNKIYDVAEKIEEHCRTAKIGRIILDEAHVIKGYNSDQSLAMTKIISSPYKIALTGTPIMNKHDELYPILRWLDKTNLNYFQFRDKYCIMGGYKNKQIVGNKNGEELNRHLSDCMIRRKKDILNLPPKIIIDEYLEMDLKQANLYTETIKKLKQQIKIKGSRNVILNMFSTCRKISDDPSWVSANCEESVKFERCIQLVNNITENNEKVIVFSNWSTPISKLYDLLKPYNPAYIGGGVSLEDRDKEINRFQTDNSCKVILGTVGAMGVGVTLTAATNVIFIDEPWNKAIKDQAEDRAHRIGTKSSVNIYTLLCKNTLDEKVHKIVFEKGLVAEVVVDGMSLEEMNKLLEEEDGYTGNKSNSKS